MSPPEVLLWSRLRRRLPDQPVWRRQHPIGPYIADFFCPAARLVAEVDGHAHGDEDQHARDVRRDAWMNAQGLAVQRVPASSVMTAAVDVADGLRLMALAILDGKS